MQSKASLSFSLRIFPSDVWQQVPLTVQDKGGGIDGFSLINIAGIREAIRQSLMLTPDSMKAIGYQVTIVRNRPLIRKEGDVTLEKLNDLSLYNTYVDVASSERLQLALNTKDNDDIYQVETRTYIDVKILIMPRPRDVATLFYTKPSLPESFAYEITIFDNSETQWRLLDAYTKRIALYNEKKVKPPLYFVNPVNEAELRKGDRIVFVVRKKEDDQIVGYCACTILVYRTEIERLLREKLREIKMLGNAKEAVLSRYFMDEEVHNLYEIEGLSVDPLEQGNDIGRVLLYEALHFIRTPLILNRFYPVSHVTAQSASSITKYLLTTGYRFRYHGPNIFLNENFVETLSREIKQRLMHIIKETVAYYNSMLQDKSTMVKIRQENVKIKQQLFTAVIRLYQLYYLLLLSGAQKLVSLATQDDPIDEFIDLLAYMMILLGKNKKEEALSSYFRLNNQALVLYKETLDIKGLDEPIYTQRFIYNPELAQNELAPLESLPEKYMELGFLIQLDYAHPMVHKETYLNGYEVIYAAVYTMTMLRSPNHIAALNIFNNINLLLLTDLNQDFNYQVATHTTIEEQLTNLLDTGSLSKRENVIRQTLAELRARESYIVRNTERNAAIAHSIYNLDYNVLAGFDTWISVKRLIAEWPDIERELLQKLNLKSSVVVVAASKRPRPRPSLPLPNSREALFREIFLLKQLLVTNNEGAKMAVFMNGTYSLVFLKKRFIQLMSERDTFGLEEEDMQVEVIDVIQQHQDDIHVYKLTDFINEGELDPLSGDPFFKDNILETST